MIRPDKFLEINESKKRPRITFNARQQAILTLLEGQHFVRVADLAQQFGVNPMTIRRDLEVLARHDLVARLHGGCRLTQRGLFDRALAVREQLHTEAKRSIGARAAELVESGQHILIDTGSTPLAVARALAARSITGVTVFTSSLSVLWELYEAAHLRVIALGGDLQRETGQLYGPLTENVLATLAVDLAFMGADGIDGERGFCTTTPETARMAAAMTRIARRFYVVADGSKVGAPAPFIYAPLTNAHLITDHLTPEQRNLLHQAGVSFEETETEA